MKTWNMEFTDMKFTDIERYDASRVSVYPTLDEMVKACHWSYSFDNRLKVFRLNLGRVVIASYQPKANRLVYQMIDIQNHCAALKNIEGAAIITIINKYFKDNYDFKTTPVHFKYVQVAVTVKIQTNGNE